MLKFDDDFFKAEYKEGFYVRECIKHHWAAGLEVLARIDDICRRHDIRYFVFYGTMLGAVRHKGYIPWDDDLDIAITRKEYMKFIKYAKEEMTDGLWFLNVYENAGMPTRIINGRSITTEPSFLEKYHGCPYVVGVDVFILDNVGKDENELDIIRNMYTVGSVSAVELDKIKKGKEKDYDIDEVNNNIASFEQFTGQTFVRDETLQDQIGLVLDRLAALYYDDENPDYYAIMGYFYREHTFGRKYPRHCFDDVVYMPFENMMVPVPAGYDELLRGRYGNYMEYVMNAGSHEYPSFKDEILILSNKYKELGFEMPKEYAWVDEPTEENA